MITITTKSSSSVKPGLRFLICPPLLREYAEGGRAHFAARGRGAAGGADGRGRARAGGAGVGATRRRPLRAAAGAQAHRRGTRLVRTDVGSGASEAVVEVRQALALVVARAVALELIVALAPALPAVAGLVDRRADPAVGLGAGVGGDAAVAQVVVEVIGSGAGLHADRVPVRLPHLQDVVPRHGVGHRRARAGGDDAATHAERIGDARLHRLQQRVVQHVAPAAAVARLRAGLGEVRAIVRVQRLLRLHPAAVLDVAENVDRAAVRHGGGDADCRLVNVVAPDAHIAVGAFGFDRVVPGVRDPVAVDVAVLVREADVGEVVAAAERVVQVLGAVGAVHVVVAQHVVAAAVLQGDSLRSGRVAEVPAVGGVARVVQLVALDDEALDLVAEVAAVRVDRGIGVHADLPAVAERGAQPAPAADVVVLDHHVVRARQHVDAVALRAFHRQAAHDDVGRRDGDREVLRVRHVDGRRPLVHDIAVLGAALGDRQRVRAALDLHGLGDREALRPGLDVDPGLEAAADADLDRVVGAGLEVHDAAAALRVARVVPHREALLPRRLVRLPVAHAAAVRAGVAARLPVHAERFEGRDRAR